MIRCKECGQSKGFSLKNAMGETINFELNDLGTHVEKADTEADVLNQDIAVAVEAALLAADELEITCKCGHAQDITDARTAFEDPLEFFETENLCHCGKELWFDKVPGTNVYALICDDEECGWIKRTGAVSGA